VQIAALRTIPALRQVEIMRPGYAIEYDAVACGQFDGAMASRLVEGLYHAGQIHGTSGYEEAAAQGLIAGINAALWVQSKPPLILRRDQAYIGVMIDDLVTKPQSEPYRIFTSRAEYRLLLRQDNADLRLTPIGYELGLISRQRHEATEGKRQAIRDELTRLETTWLRPTDPVNAALAAAGLPILDDGANALALLRRPEVRYALIQATAPAPEALPPDTIEEVEIECKYAGYIARQQTEVDRMARLEDRRVPAGFDYCGVPGLRNEAREQLMSNRPLTVGQASRLPGVTPADVTILLVYLERSGVQGAHKDSVRAEERS